MRAATGRARDVLCTRAVREQSQNLALRRCQGRERLVAGGRERQCGEEPRHPAELLAFEPVQAFFKFGVFDVAELGAVIRSDARSESAQAAHRRRQPLLDSG
jgi:hypothetical protein